MQNLWLTQHPEVFDSLYDMLGYYPSQDSIEFCEEQIEIAASQDLPLFNPEIFDDQITLTLPPCLEAIVNDLKTLQNGKFGKVIKKFAGNNPVPANYNWNITTSPQPTSLEE